VIENRVSQISAGHELSLPPGPAIRNGKGGKLPVAPDSFPDYVITM
jgi:hypothetical protein